MWVAVGEGDEGSKGNGHLFDFGGEVGVALEATGYEAGVYFWGVHFDFIFGFFFSQVESGFFLSFLSGCVGGKSVGIVCANESLYVCFDMLEKERRKVENKLYVCCVPSGVLFFF